MTGDLTPLVIKVIRQALADTSTTQLSAPLTVDAASATTASRRPLSQVKAAAPQTQQSGRPRWDTTAPTVSLTGPAGGATVSGTVTLGATATDNKGVARVEFCGRHAASWAPRTPPRPRPVSWNTTRSATAATR